mmetsp:Transcript_4334/g.7878  ORF Transcript_4334/g.7878 Transcript_4334/m.7878 type:complete len:224 (-) Transcript_4334:113-784(-)
MTTGMDLSDPVFVDLAHFQLEDPASPMTWRFVTQPLDLPTRPLGSYIRFQVGGREVPTYSCQRSPTQNWGFVMESCWGVLASFELPPRPREPRHRRLRRRLRRAHNLEGREIYVQVNVEDSSDDEEQQGQSRNHNRNNGNDDDDSNNNSNQNHDGMLVDGLNRNDWGNGSRNGRHLIYDDSFNVTVTLQWREAFLYNIGRETLPEGNNALGEFERIYNAFQEE